MAEGLVNHYLAKKVQAFSAGVASGQVNPRAIRVMEEIGIDISSHRSKSVSEFKAQEFDLVITVCDLAREQCPFLPGAARMLHAGFPVRVGRRAQKMKSWRSFAGCGT